MNDSLSTSRISPNSYKRGRESFLGLRGDISSVARHDVEREAPRVTDRDR